MNLQFFIAKRYLFSKKTVNIINIISLITGVGVAIGTTALIVVLSVFNGLEDFISSRINTFVPDIKITAKEGKSFISNSVDFEKIKKLNEVAYYCETIEENALIKYRDIFHPFKIKGVSNNFSKMTKINKMMLRGEFSLYYKEIPFAVIGRSVESCFSVGLNFINPLKIYLPNRLAKISNDPEKTFTVKSIYPIGVYSIDPDVDEYVIVPIDFAREMLNYSNRSTAIEIGLKKNTDQDKTQSKIESILGNNFNIKNRYQQNELFYKTLNTEELMTFLILTFILLIASFNIIGSLTMLIIDKKKDARIIQSMGAELPKIRKIFLYEGWLITALGAISGLLLGALICWLQIKYGFIKLQYGDTDSFIIDAYPLKMQITDFIIVFCTVMLIGFVTAWYPVRYLTKKYIFNTTL